MKNIRIALFAFCLFGCAITNPEMNDVEGVWESTGLIYQRIEIDQKGIGFFGSGIGDDIEFCHIRSTSFNGNKVILNLFCEENDVQEIQAEGHVSQNTLVINRYVISGEVQELPVSFMYLNESMVESTKREIEKKIKESKKE